MKQQSHYEVLTSSEYHGVCYKCEAAIPPGTPFMRRRNGWRRCLREICGGATPQERVAKPTAASYDAARPEDEIRRDARREDVFASDKRRRGGGHGYSGGDGFIDIR